MIGELDGAPAATVSCVEYGATFAFLGFYIVREDLRGRGYGLRIWDAAIAHTGPRVIGLDGVVAQQQNYRKSGFELAYANVRCGGIVAASGCTAGWRHGAGRSPLAAVEACATRQCFRLRVPTGTVPTDDDVRLHNRQRLDGIWHQTIQPNKDQAIHRTEGQSLRQMPALDVKLITKDQDLSFPTTPATATIRPAPTRPGCKLLA